ncbi:hypothetical protein L3H35_10325, partial [Corynebacterium sp. MC-21]|nr:hypothetical protein [Corynebacterium parakroppenstedtii]MCF6790179.1 hypothetical protein [Corynebacterium parakroppenstedtii]
ASWSNFLGIFQIFPSTQTEQNLGHFTGRAMVASENISALNADFMAIYAQSGSDEEMRQIPGYIDLTQVKKKATKVGDSALVQGLNVPSSLSREWLLKELRPELENAAK